MASGADLLEKMRRSPNGHSFRDFQRLLLHYGFVRNEGGKYTVYSHELLDAGRVVTVPRNRSIKAHVARNAVAAVDFILERRKSDGEDV